MPLIFVAASPVQQTQFQNEVKLPSSSLNDTQKLKDYLVNLVFEDNIDNQKAVNIIEDILKRIIEEKTRSEISKKETRSTAINLIEKTKKLLKIKMF